MPITDTQPDEGDLGPEEPTERELAGGSRHTYTLNLEADEYVRVAAEQRGVDVVLRLFAPQGELLAEIDSPTGSEGTERLEHVAGTAGPHRVEVEALDPGAPPGRYALSLEAKQPAGEADRLRVEAARAFERGERLRRERRYAEAVVHYETALEGWHQLEDRRREARALYRLGWVHQASHERRRAIERLEAAREIFRELDDPIAVATVHNRLGSLLLELGRHEAALERYGEALAIFKRHDHRRGQATALNGLGNVHRWSDRTEEALRAYEEALDIWRALDSPEDEAVILASLGELYLAGGEPGRARERYSTARELARSGGDRAAEARALSGLGEALRRLGEPGPAREHLEAALEICRSLGLQRDEAIALGIRGTLDLEAEALEAAGDAFQAAREIFRELDDGDGEAMMVQKLGRLATARGELERARELHHRAAELFAAAKDRQGMVSARYGEALMLHRQGEHQAAREILEVILEAAEDLRTTAHRPGLRAAYLAFRRHYWELYVDTLMQLHGDDPEGGFDLLALQVSERARARSLLDLLGEASAGVRTDVEPELLEREGTLLGKLDGVERQRLELASRSADEELLAALDERRRRLLDELARLRAEIRLASARYAALTDPDPLRLPQLRRDVLDQSTQLLVYFLGEERSYLWLVSRDEVTSVTLPGREAIETPARRLHELLARTHSRATASRDRVSRELSRTILGPVAGRLVARRLVVVADGALAYLPFAALPVPEETPGEGDEPLLIDRHEVIHLPSTAVLESLRRITRQRERAPRHLAILADPVFSADDPRLAGGEGSPTAAGESLLRTVRSLGLEELERLPGTGKEAEAILELLPEEAETALYRGLEARRELLVDGQLADFRVLHLATHALVDPETPELTGIVLSLVDEEGRPDNGFVRLHELYRLELGADLVVLSACRTGLGKEVRGEGLVGLTRGFFHAGVPRVIHSLWSVDDESTAELMRRFYEAHLLHGLPPAEALRAAQREMRADPETRVPFHWAGFVFEGDWTRPPLTEGDIPIEKADSGGLEPGAEPPPDDYPTPPPPDDEPPRGDLEF